MRGCSLHVLDCAWIRHIALLTNTTEKNLAGVMDHELTDMVSEFGQLRYRVRAILIELARDRLKIIGFCVDNLLIAYCNKVVISSWQVHY